MKSPEEHDREWQQIEDQISQRESKYREISQNTPKNQSQSDFDGQFEVIARDGNADGNIQFYQTTKV